MSLLIERPENNWIQTRHRRAFSLTRPIVEHVDIHDIAHALSQICRFNGHTRVPYSVAEHCVRCSDLVEPAFALDALLHDAAEAYLGDISTPLKRELGRAWSDIEERVERVIAEYFGLLYPQPRAVANADRIMLSIECRDLLGMPLNDWLEITPATDEMQRIAEPWSADFARHRFMERYWELIHDRGNAARN